MARCSLCHAKDVDVATGTVRVVRALSWVGGEPIVGTPKSAAGTRVVSIPPHILPAIAHHLDTMTTPAADALLFPGRDGVSHLQPSTMHRHWRMAREAAGRPDLRVHDLRHTGATMAARAGATLAELQEWLGHSSVNAALRYQHASPIPHIATAHPRPDDLPESPNVTPSKSGNAVNVTPCTFRLTGSFSDAKRTSFRYRGFMSGEELQGCPQCGAPVYYAGRGRRPVWCSSRCRNIAAVTRRGAREAGVQIRMIDVPKAPKPRPERTPTREERDESAISRVARSSRLTRELLVRLERRRRAGELDREVWADVTAMLDQFIPGPSPRATPPAAPPAAEQPASATTVPEIIRAMERLSAGLETGRISDSDVDVCTLGPALDRLGNAWVRRTSR